MTIESEAAAAHPRPIRGDCWSWVIGAVAVLTSGVVIAATIFFLVYTSGHSNFQTISLSGHGQYPTGAVDATEPSGKSPPGPNSLAGYALTYETDFASPSVPSGWDVYSGVPGGVKDGQFASSHVVVANGILRLNAWRDPKYQNRWVTGGLCQCGLAKTYGAYFVRSRVTGAGPNEVELLWPATNDWPPEIDFNETGGVVEATSSTLHWGAINQIDQRSVSINMENWHTWGVIWSPQSVTYIVDGQVWGKISTASEIAKVPMTLDFEQIAVCDPARQCPTHPVSMLVDWVAEYSPKMAAAS
jgi:hypothetical protein